MKNEKRTFVDHTIRNYFNSVDVYSEDGIRGLRDVGGKMRRREDSWSR